MALWMVRTGKMGEREDFDLENRVAAIGWEEMPDMTPILSREELRAVLDRTYPEERAKILSNWEGQLWVFRNEMKPADLIALPLKKRAVIAFGEISGNYRYEKSNPIGSKHTRPVKSWQEIPRNAFDQDILYSFGSLLAICQIKRNDAENRVKAILAGKKTILPPEPDADEEGVQDLEQLARDQLVKHIEQKFKGDRLAYLVEAILNAQGYKTRVSPKGADGGVDILAGKGELGFDAPRLAVQVKSWDAPVDIKVVHELQGAMVNFNAEQGLLVTWGGYKSSVEKEAAKLFFKLRIWDADTLVKMIQENYNQLSPNIQADLPMKQIWALVQEEENE